jgi:hypothetical protein
MTAPDTRAWLRAALEDLAQARGHLAYSSARVAGLDFSGVAPTAEQLERVEAYTSRFARVVDLLANRALRALDRHELIGKGTVLDVLHRAEKRGLIDDAEGFRALKEVRNVIAHDYSGAELTQLLAFCRVREALLNAEGDRVENYTRARLDAGPK